MSATIYKYGINVKSLRKSSARRLAAGLIAPPTEDVHMDVVQEHSAQPIKSMDDIHRVSDYLIDSGRYRDNMLFIVGINFGLRVSDLRMLRFSHLINENYTFKTSFPVFEKKTRNTRKRKKNRYITINDAVVDAITLYLENEQARREEAGEVPVTLSDYLFMSVSNNSVHRSEPLSIKSIDRILKGIAEDLDLGIRMSTHTLRKTFAYWVMVMGHNDQRRLLLLQKMFNHSSPAQTLAYIGLDSDEITAAYNSLNLGSSTPLIGSEIYESDTEAV